MPFQEVDMGAFEKLFWLIDEHHPTHFTLTAQVTGPCPSLEEWQYALSQAQARHPLLTAAFLEKRPSLLIGNIDVIPLRLIRGKKQPHWCEVMADEMVLGFDYKRAPLARAVVVETPTGFDFTFSAHHSIGDGMSGTYFIRDVLQVLNKTELSILPLGPSQAERLSALKITYDNQAKQPENPATAGELSSYRPRDHVRPAVHGIRLSAQETEALRQRARREETTVHGVLCAAASVAGAQGQICDHQIIRIVSPIETRTLLGITDDFGLFITSARASLDPSLPFWELAREARRIVVSEKNLASLAQATSSFKETMLRIDDMETAAIFTSQALAREVLLTNLGILPFETTIGAWTLDALWGPATLLGFEKDHTIGAATVNGRLCLTHTTHALKQEELLGYMVAILQDVCRDD